MWNSKQNLVKTVDMVLTQLAGGVLAALHAPVESHKMLQALQVNPTKNKVGLFKIYP